MAEDVDYADLMSSAISSCSYEWLVEYLVWNLKPWITRLCHRDGNQIRPGGESFSRRRRGRLRWLPRVRRCLPLPL
jgi:hypothetical protein